MVTGFLDAVNGWVTALILRSAVVVEVASIVLIVEQGLARSFDCHILDAFTWDSSNSFGAG